MYTAKVRASVHVLFIINVFNQWVSPPDFLTHQPPLHSPFYN